MSDIHKRVKDLRSLRDDVTRQIDAELAKLRVLCDHERTKSYTLCELVEENSAMRVEIKKLRDEIASRKVWDRAS